MRRPLLTGLWRDATESVSAVVIVICLVVFLVMAGLDAAGIANRGSMLSVFGLSYYGLIKFGRVYEIITSPFIHANLQHLVFNMLALWFLGPAVESSLGRKRYITFSLTCAITASVGFLLVDHGAGVIGIGYSGVIFGLITAQAIMRPDQHILVMLFFPMKMKYAAFLLGATELYFTMAGQGDGVAHSAHVFGIVGACAFLWVARHRRRLKEEQRADFLQNVQQIPNRQGRYRVR